jgi:hypothetical protein
MVQLQVKHVPPPPPPPPPPGGKASADLSSMKGESSAAITQNLIVAIFIADGSTNVKTTRQYTALPRIAASGVVLCPSLSPYALYN